MQQKQKTLDMDQKKRYGNCRKTFLAGSVRGVILSNFYFLHFSTRALLHA